MWTRLWGSNWQITTTASQTVTALIQVNCTATVRYRPSGSPLAARAPPPQREMPGVVADFIDSLFNTALNFLEQRGLLPQTKLSTDKNQQLSWWPKFHTKVNLRVMSPSFGRAFSLGILVVNSFLCHLYSNYLPCRLLSETVARIFSSS